MAGREGRARIQIHASRPGGLQTDTKSGGALGGLGRQYCVRVELERLTQPLVRDGGRLRPASWDEALNAAAAGFAKARALGPNGFGMFSCSKTTNEMNFMAQKFTRVVMGSNNVDSCNRT